jgi:Uma2 family endonuclease
MSETIEIKLPDKYPITDQLIEEIQLLNLDLKIGKTNGNTLTVDELAYQFYDYGFVELKFPASIFPDSDFDELYDINEDELNFEQPGNHSIILKMGILDAISLLTMAIGATLYMWAYTNNKGRVRSENGEYQLNKNQIKKKKGSRMGDVTFVSYDKASKEEQDKWLDGRIPIAPTLCIEIVSSKYGLKHDLNKMEAVWMRKGTDVGVVVCPYSKKIYIFEKDAPSYREQSIFEPFTHPLLPGYVGDFNHYINR